jgi:hypothetical protein
MTMVVIGTLNFWQIGMMRTKVCSTEHRRILAGMSQFMERPGFPNDSICSKCFFAVETQIGETPEEARDRHICRKPSVKPPRVTYPD